MSDEEPMSEAEKVEVAEQIDELVDLFGPQLNASKAHPLSKAMALARMAASESVHDGATEEDFRAVCSAAWNAANAHCGCGHN